MTAGCKKPRQRAYTIIDALVGTKPDTRSRCTKYSGSASNNATHLGAATENDGLYILSWSHTNLPPHGISPVRPHQQAHHFQSNSASLGCGSTIWTLRCPLSIAQLIGIHAGSTRESRVQSDGYTGVRLSDAGSSAMEGLHGCLERAYFTPSRRGRRRGGYDTLAVLDWLVFFCPCKHHTSGLGPRVRLRLCCRDRIGLGIRLQSILCSSFLSLT